ncbi:MAG: ribosomal-protein-alanine N-acetyltransferase [Ruminococcaceae bacterium]|nr:ribosomal-protein-alanine N-acetyltransferase [Oscillospiraceae bacterium]
MTAQKMERVHIGDVAEIERESFSEPWSAQALELLVSDAAIGAVVLDGERAVAYGGMLWAPDEGQITNIAVREDYRHRGLGRAILAYLIDAARSRGCTLISLEVRESNAAAIALYERYGFGVAGRRKRFYKHPAEDALVMLLHLN